MRCKVQGNSKRFSAIACALLLVGAGAGLRGQTCTTQAEMQKAERNALIAVSQQLSHRVAANDTQALQADIAPQVAADATGILHAVSDVAPIVTNATFTVDNLYLLDAANLKPEEASVRFYCGVFNHPERVVLTLGSLPQGRYALALVHATGVLNPQQIAAIFAEAKGKWKLAGFSFRPLTIDGHDSVWYWKQARAYASKNEKWNAYFYDETAHYLAAPADYLSSTNLDKLTQEQESAQPAGLPGAQPMQLSAKGQSFAITQIGTSGDLGGLDLVIHYNAAGNGKDANNLTAARRQNIAVMQAMLQAHPELKDAFHGLWVYAVVPGQAPFGIELPMQQIP